MKKHTASYIVKTVQAGHGHCHGTVVQIKFIIMHSDGSGHAWDNVTCAKQKDSLCLLPYFRQL